MGENKPYPRLLFADIFAGGITKFHEQQKKAERKKKKGKKKKRRR